MKPPPSILPKLAGVTAMAAKVLLVAYSVADDRGVARRLLSSKAMRACGQNRREIGVSLSELETAGLARVRFQGGSVCVELADIQARTEGDALRACRHDLDETQEQFAARLGVHAGTIGRWENGESRIPQRVLAILPARSEAA